VSHTSTPGRRAPLLLGAVVAVVVALAPVVAALAATLLQISSDPFTNTTSQHQTQVEPDTFSFGSTIVSAFQSGRFTDGGSSDIGWATSTDGGTTWTNGFLPGTTPYSTPTGPYARVSDPSVAYDAKHNVWLIASLPLNSSPTGVGAIVSRSTDGGMTFGNPVVVANQNGSDKSWIVCDDTATSPFYGNCYVEWDDNAVGNLIQMSTSSDGGLTWGAPMTTANRATGIGGQPVVQPSGKVIVPIDNAFETAVLAFTSTNGGASWGSTVTVSTISSHAQAGGLRSGPLPSAEIDAAGRVYVAWADCRFETGCTADDIVLSTSKNGTTWSPVHRIPIDAVGSGVDHFLPGLAVDKSTSGMTAHLGLVYYYYPNANCSSTTCQLDVGFVSSTNGGKNWSASTQLAGPMQLSWLPNTTLGRMVGDYFSTSFVNGKAFPVLMNATAPSGTTFHESANTVLGGLAVTGGDLATTPEQAVSPAGAASSASGAPAKVQ
jgi:hypothetical protein